MLFSRSARDRIERIVPLLMAMLIATLYAAPTGRFIEHQTNIAAAYNEPIGYRYFWTMRNVDGVDDFTHPGQGPLIGVLQKMIYVGLKIGDSAPQSNLVAKMNLFGYLTNLATVALMTLLLMTVALSRGISLPSKVLLLALPMLFSYGWYYGFHYTLTPDYAILLPPLMLWTAFIATQILAKPPGESATASELFQGGLVAGLAVSLKITYVFAPVALIGAAILSRPHRKIRDLGGVLAICVLIYLLAILVYYDFSYQFVLLFLKYLFGWAIGMSGGGNPAAPNFMAEFLNVDTNWGSPTSYVVPLAELVFSLLVISYIQGRLRKYDVVLLAAVAAIGVNFIFVILRQAPATAFDFSVVPPLAVTVALARLPGTRERAVAYLVVAGVALAAPAAWWGAHASWVRDNLGVISSLAAVDKNGRFNEQIYNWNRSHGLPIVLLIPDASYDVGTVEDMMWRGFAGLPWSGGWIANDNSTRKRLFPEYIFINYSESFRAQLPSRYVFMWTDFNGPPVTAPGFDLKVHHDYLRRYGYLQLEYSDRCRNWPTNHILIVHSCVIDRPPLSGPG